MNDFTKFGWILYSIFPSPSSGEIPPAISQLAVVTHWQICCGGVIAALVVAGVDGGNVEGGNVERGWVKGGCCVVLSVVVEVWVVIVGGWVVGGWVVEAYKNETTIDSGFETVREYEL